MLTVKLLGQWHRQPTWRYSALDSRMQLFHYSSTFDEDTRILERIGDTDSASLIHLLESL